MSPKPFRNPDRSAPHGLVMAVVCVALTAVVAAMASLNLAVPDIARGLALLMAAATALVVAIGAVVLMGGHKRRRPVQEAHAFAPGTDNTRLPINNSNFERNPAMKSEITSHDSSPLDQSQDSRTSVTRSRSFKRTVLAAPSGIALAFLIAACGTTGQQATPPNPVGSKSNGSAVLSPRVILVADSGAGLIWRVDLSADGMKGSVRVWLKDPSMDLNPRLHFAWTQPGVNGLAYDPRTGYLYYTATAYQLFMRVKVDTASLNPGSSPQRLASGWMWDDFTIDGNAGLAYATTHRQNTITRIPLRPGSAEPMQIVAGDPLDYRLVGPSSVAWGSSPQDYGRVAYISSDGGFTAPPADGIVRPAKILRAVFR
jgi:hypothetical protein